MSTDMEIVVAMVALHLRTGHVELPARDALGVARHAVREVALAGTIISARTILSAASRAEEILQAHEAEASQRGQGQ